MGIRKQAFLDGVWLWSRFMTRESPCYYSSNYIQSVYSVATILADSWNSQFLHHMSFVTCVMWQKMTIQLTFLDRKQSSDDLWHYSFVTMRKELAPLFHCHQIDIQAVEDLCLSPMEIGWMNQKVYPKDVFQIEDGVGVFARTKKASTNLVIRIQYIM